MYEERIVFREAGDFERFAHAASTCEGEVDVYFNHIPLDGKSLLGLTLAGLNRMLTVCCDQPSSKFLETVECMRANQRGQMVWE